MEQFQTSKAILLILSYLERHTYEGNGASSAELLDYLQEYHIFTDRRTIYKAIKTLKELGYDIVTIHKNYKYTYAIKQEFSVGETYILMDAINQNHILTKVEKNTFIQKLSNHLPTGQKELIPALENVPLLSDNTNVLNHIELLLKAIAENREVSFLYYDFTPNKTKQYRKNGHPYIIQPVSMRSDQGRYYGIFWSKKHKSFSPYRIDKMERLTIKDSGENITFDANNYFKKNFHMYAGEDETIILEADNDLASVIFDTFGNNLLITQITDTTFTFVIHRPIVPTFVSWLFQFSPKIKVKSPPHLQDTLREKAISLLQTLKED